MKKTLLFSLLLFSVIVKAQIPWYYEERLTTVFDSICEKRNLKGASASVHIPNLGTWNGTYGISTSGVPVSSDMVIGIGSNTKTFVAALLLKMQEENLLSLNDTIGKWISHQHVDGKITIRQLLNHRSGIYSYTSNPALNDSLLSDFNRIWQPEEMMGLVEAPYFAPGSSWAYSNTNYLIAGMIIRDVLGMPFSQALREKILGPSDLNSTYLFPDEQFSAIMANPWSRNFHLSGKLFDVVNDFNYSNTAMFSMAWAAGAMVSTAEDNALFWHKLVSGQILNQSSMNEMYQLIPLNASLDYGLGIFRLKNFNNRNVYSHGGTNVGYINENIGDPVSGVGISVLTNQDSIGNNILLNQIVNALHKITINPPQDPTLVGRYGTGELINIFPNPSRGIINISGLEAGSLLKIYNLSGQEVFSEKLYSLSNINISHLPAGIYICRALGDNGEIMVQKKISVQN